MEQLSKHLQQASRSLQPTTSDGESTALSRSEERSGLISQHLSRMSDQGIDLALVVPSEPLSPAVFAAGVAQIGSIFGVDYVGGKGAEPTPDVLKVRLLWEMLRKRSWTDADFAVALDRFLATVRFATWTPADFFGGNGDSDGVRPKVYPHSWYLAQVQANKMNAEAIGIYRVDGHNKPVWGWKHEVGAKLPVWEYHPPTGNPHTQDAPELAAPKQGVPSVNAAAGGELLDRMRLQAQLEAAKGEASRYRRDLLQLGRQMEKLAEANEQIQRAFDQYASEACANEDTLSAELLAQEDRVTTLEMALAAVLVALEEDREAARIGEPQTDVEAWTPEINRLRAVLDPPTGTAPLSDLHP